MILILLRTLQQLSRWGTGIKILTIDHLYFFYALTLCAISSRVCLLHIPLFSVWTRLNASLTLQCKRSYGNTLLFFFKWFGTGKSVVLINLNHVSYVVLSTGAWVYDTYIFLFFVVVDQNSQFSIFIIHMYHFCACLRENTQFYNPY